MAKRFTDTAIWQDEWFMNLPVEYKLAFMFLKDNCDISGVWKPNKKLANMMIGFEVDWEDFLIESGAERILVLKNGSWWLIKFVEFQYGTLSEKCNPHIKVIELLKKYDLLSRVPSRVPDRVQGTLEYKEEYKYKEEEEDQEEYKEEATKIKKPPKIKHGQFVSMTEEEYLKLLELHGEVFTTQCIEALDNYKGSSGKKYKDDYRAILSWVVDKIKQKNHGKTNGLGIASKGITTTLPVVGGVKMGKL